MNVAIISLVIIAVVAVVTYIVIRNRRDKKNLIKKLNEGYRKPREDADENL